MLRFLRRFNWDTGEEAKVSGSRISDNRKKLRNITINPLPIGNNDLDCFL